MPVHSCGKGCHQYGNQKKYRGKGSKAKAARQGRAIKASQAKRGKAVR